MARPRTGGSRCDRPPPLPLIDAATDLRGSGLEVREDRLRLDGACDVADNSRVRRSKWLLSLWGVFLVVVSAVGWFLWSQAEYAGQTGCPWGTARAGHPVLVGVALSVGVAIAMALALWRPNFRPEAIALGALTGAIAGAVILVVAVLVGAGLQCTS